MPPYFPLLHSLSLSSVFFRSHDLRYLAFAFIFSRLAIHSSFSRWNEQNVLILSRSMQFCVYKKEVVEFKICPGSFKSLHGSQWKQSIVAYAFPFFSFSLGFPQFVKKFFATPHTKAVRERGREREGKVTKENFPSTAKELQKFKCSANCERCRKCANSLTNKHADCKLKRKVVPESFIKKEPII